MKIGCRCGESIIDRSDDLPLKAHLIPDQLWFDTFDAIDDEIINAIASDRMSREAGYRGVRQIIGHRSRLMWQPRA